MSSTVWCEPNRKKKLFTCNLSMLKKKNKMIRAPLLRRTVKPMCGFDVTSSWATKAMNNILWRITDTAFAQQRWISPFRRKRFSEPHLAFISPTGTDAAFQKATRFMENERECQIGISIQETQWDAIIAVAKAPLRDAASPVAFAGAPLAPVSVVCRTWALQTACVRSHIHNTL